MPRRQQQPPHPRLADQRPTTRSIHIRKITRLPNRDLAITQLIRDRSDIIDDIPTPRVVRLDVLRRLGQRHEHVALAARIDLVVGAGVDLRRDALGVRRGRAEGFVGASADGGGERDVGEEGVGGDGAGGADGDAVGAQGGDGRWGVEGLRPGAGGEDDVRCGDGAWLAGFVVLVGDGVDGVGGLVDVRDGAEDDFGAFLCRQLGHGRGELVGVHLGCGVGTAHFVVVFYAFCGEPVEVLRYACCSQSADGLLTPLLQ